MGGSLNKLRSYLGSLHNFFSPLEGFALSLVILYSPPMRASYALKKCRSIFRFCCFFSWLPTLQREQINHSTNQNSANSSISESYHDDSTASDSFGASRNSSFEVLTYENFHEHHEELNHNQFGIPSTHS